MTEQVKNKKKMLSVVYLIIGIICAAGLLLLILFHNVYAPDHPKFDSFAAMYYGVMLLTAIGFPVSFNYSDSLKEEISEKNWFITYFIPNTEMPPPFRYVVKSVDEQEAEVKFKEAYPYFKIVYIAKK